MQADDIKNEEEMKIDGLLKLMVGNGASDLHLKVASPPVLRIDGVLTRLADWPSLASEDLEFIFEQISNQEQRLVFLRELELDFTYSVSGVGRFRVNALKQRGTLGLAFRLVPFTVPTIDELGLPQILKDIILKPRGLVLVTGPTGSGKSTTLAAMINHLNEHENRSVITIEDPIEFLHSDKKCVIAQRDLGDDTRSFSAALTYALRHDIEVIVVGELRDLATISTALRAAETGHLVIGTLHTNDAPRSIDRIVDVFPYEQQRQVRLQLSQVIEAVVSQMLLRRSDGGRLAAFEIMLANSVVKRLIREDKAFEIHPNIEMGKLEGMKTMDQSLVELVKSKMVTQEEAMAKSGNPARLNSLINLQSDEVRF